MRRRVVESALLTLAWLGPLLVAPSALASALVAGGFYAPAFLIGASALIGARRTATRTFVPLVMAAAVTGVWALSARAPIGAGVGAEEIATFTLAIFGCVTLVPALARTLEPADALESHFGATFVADTTAILGSVVLAVLFDLGLVLGGAASVLVALLGLRLPFARVRAGLAILVGGLLDAWLGLPALMEPLTDLVAVDVTLADLVHRASVLAACAVLSAVVLVAGQDR